MDSKANLKNRIIGVILIIIIISIIAGLGVLGYFALNGKKEKAPEQEAEPEVLTGSSKAGSGEVKTLESNGIATKAKKKMMEGYEIIGEMRIPKVDLKTNILAETTKRTLEIAVAQIYTTSAINQPGNTVIYGHNYRNSLFFSRNDELENGDVIYVKDSEENEKKYVIYDTFITTSTDTSFYTRTAEQTGGKAEITLSTCTDDASTTDRRLIILAREE